MTTPSRTATGAEMPLDDLRELIARSRSATTQPDPPSSTDEVHNPSESAAIPDTGTEADLQTQVALADLLARAGSCPDLRSACQQLAAGLKELLRCADVAIGVCPPGKASPRLTAVASLPTFDPQADRIRAMQSALDESVVRETIGLWPPAADDTRHALEAHRHLATLSEVAGVISVPLCIEPPQAPAGALLFLLDQKPESSPDAKRLAECCRGRLATSLNLWSRAESGAWLRRCHSFFRSPGRHRLLMWLSAVLFLVALSCIPIRHTIRCDCEVQPTSRRFIAAPFECSLKEALARSGDVVSKDDLLATLDGRELHWKLGSIEADYQQALKRRDSQLAEQKPGAARLTQFEIDQLDLEKRLLEHRISQLDVRSPMDGVVISGDLERAAGVRLTLGQTLFEVAPLDRIVVEMAVPEAEISHVREGMDVAVNLDAAPGRTSQGRVTRIHPHSELKDHSNVFIAEIELINGELGLRPGMRGRAGIRGDVHSLAWVYLHRPWHRFLISVGW